MSSLPRHSISIIFIASSSLSAQVPEGWNEHGHLGSDLPGTLQSWWGAGTWAGEQHGPPAPLVNAMGLGSGLAGSGIHLEGGLRMGSWDVAGEITGYRNPDGRSHLSFYRGHAWWKSKGGWQAGFEREPIVWGYGLNGGYLLSEAARPFPRLRLETPMRSLNLWGVPLGTWGFQTFLGRLEQGRRMSPLVQDPSSRRQSILRYGDPQAPWLTGYRLQARFGPKVEFYANYINLFGGSLNGQSMTSGYSISEYLTAAFGLKDALAEAHVDFSDPNRPGWSYRNDARSASNADLGMRIRSASLERLLGAEDARFYVSRGSKGVTMSYGLFFRRPLYWLWKDVERDARNLLQGHPGLFWNETQRKSLPNLVVPNDSIGLLVKWPGLRIGLEYQDTVNPTGLDQHRSFAHAIYLTGFYYHGDPLGNAIGGEARTTTLTCELDIRPGLQSSTWVHVGERLFRDDLSAWSLDHPGAVPEKNRFLGLQQTLSWRLRPSATLNLGAAWARHSAVEFVAGRTGNGFRWYGDLTFRWPSK